MRSGKDHFPEKFLLSRVDVDTRWFMGSFLLSHANSSELCLCNGVCVCVCVCPQLNSQNRICVPYLPMKDIYSAEIMVPFS